MALKMAKSPLALSYMLLLLAVLDGVRATSFCQKVVEPFGYGCAEYSVQTDDGFVLVMHRLSRVHSLVGKGHTDTAQPPVDSRNSVTGKGKPQSRGASDPACSTANPSSSQIPSCNDGATPGGTAGASAHPAYPHVPATFRSKNTDPLPDNSTSVNESSTEGVDPSISSGPTPAPDTSVSANTTSEDSSSVEASIGADPAPSSTDNAAGSSGSQQTITGSSPSNYTARPEVRVDPFIPII